MNTRKAMVVVCVALIFATIGVSIYHVSHELGRYDGRASLVLGALMGAINAVAAWSFLEVPKSRWVSTPTFVAAAGVSMWLQIRFYQQGGAPEIDAYILGAWCPAFELMLGALFAKLTEGAQPNDNSRTAAPNALNAIGLAFAERIRTNKSNEHPNARTVSAEPVVSRSDIVPPVPNGDLSDVNAQRGAAKEQAIERMLVYYRQNPNASLSEVGGEIGKAKSTVSAYLGELETAGVIHRNGNGVEFL
jgi:hypothetical protein